MSLPVEAVLPRLRAALATERNAVLIAPPGAGKTTAVAPALLSEPWCDGEILLLSPRRVAARAAAERMAALAGEAVGQTFGYATRMDSRRGPSTRVTVMTEGIFRNHIQADPELAGVSCVVFDEVHERSLDSDASLAFALDAQGGLRPDLRLVAMSATLSGERFATLMAAPIIESAGKAWPLTSRYLGRSGERIETAMAAAIRQALRDTDGGILAFLPGVAEIERTAQLLEDLTGVQVYRLHGQIAPAEQRAAIAPAPHRKLVLATSIAETSLTLDGISVVVDSGLARRPRYDRGAGMTRLVTERASQAAVTQRAGRAARQGPGIAYRLWEEAATAGLPPFDPPEILESDLSGLLLDCALWGVGDPAKLAWLDPPPAAATAEARARLAAFGALDEAGRITPHGRAMAAMPLPPRLAHMVSAADDKGLAAELAMLLTERGLGGSEPDLALRLERWRREDSARATAARRAARRLGGDGHRRGAGDASPGATLALAYPDRVARRRSADGADWASIGGRAFRLDPASSLARADWLAVAETQGAAAGARILSAAPIAEAEVLAMFAYRVTQQTDTTLDRATGQVRARQVRRLGRITLSSTPVEPTADAVLATLTNAFQLDGLALLDLGPVSAALLARARYAAVDLDEARLQADVPAWLPEALACARGFRDIPDARLARSWRNLLSWEAQQRLEALAPESFVSPAATRHAIDYAAPAGPTVTLRAQALFGLDRHPMIGTTPLLLTLTSPAGRPIQTTGDLPAFWRGSWAEVAKDMRGRYPRHDWPAEPWTATADLRSKKALGKSGAGALKGGA